MIYDDLLQKQLFDNSTIMDLLSADPDVPTAPALYNDLVIPETLGKEATTINFYGLSYNDEGYGEETFAVNCRAPGHAEAKTLSSTIRDELHRANNDNNDALFVCSIQQTLPPIDTTDNYNSPMTIKVTTRAIR